MADRYFVQSPITGQHATLAGAEAHHLAHVMRARPGTEVVLFDGSGAEFTARVVEAGRSSIELAVIARRLVDRELPLPITLGAALPKGDRQRWLVEKAVELGVARLVPLDTERGVAGPAASALARLRRAVIEASKQCGRNRLMEIAPPEPLGAFAAAAAEGACRLLAHPGGVPVDRALAEHARAARQSLQIRLAVGPEGGLTGGEVNQFVACGWQAVDLGPVILRVETAALVLCALAAQWGRNAET
jgi:16S rRNA (uracil1498-N3)-methyltransferase